MVARAPSAILLSVLLHGAVVTTILALAFVVQQRRAPPLQIFELVAGPPTDLTATVAPALGSPDGGVEVKIPAAPARTAPTVEELAPPPAKPETTKPVARAETRVAAPDRATGKQEPKLTYEQYVKKYGQPAPTKPGAAGSTRAPAVPKINAKGIAEGVVGGSATSTGGGGGRALTAAQHSAVEAYIARLVTALRQNHEKPPGLSDLLEADVEFLIAADGSISRVHIVRPSGNASFDRSCVDAFKRMGSVGTKPDGKTDTWVLTFRMKEE
jgi:colicin import membrane protein